MMRFVCVHHDGMSSWLPLFLLLLLPVPVFAIRCCSAGESSKKMRSCVIDEWTHEVTGGRTKKFIKNLKNFVSAKFQFGGWTARNCATYSIHERNDANNDYHRSDWNDGDDARERQRCLDDAPLVAVATVVRTTNTSTASIGNGNEKTRGPWIFVWQSLG